MIMKQTNDIIKDIINRIGHDKEICKILCGREDITIKELIEGGYIAEYPVILDDNSKPIFISVHHDNSLPGSNNTYITTFKISCGVSHDAWKDENGDVRVYLLADRLEEILNGIRPNQSTGEFELAAINSIYWNAFVTGVTLIFQIVEEGDINETII